MTDVLRIAHPQDCPLEGNPEVGNPEIHLVRNVMKHTIHKWGGDISSTHEVIALRIAHLRIAL